MTQKALLQGAGDGTAVPQGYVGENIKNAPSGNTAITTFTTTDLTGTNTGLTPGIWLLIGNLGGYGSSTGGNASIDFLIRDAANNNIVRGQGLWTSGALNTVQSCVSHVVTIAGFTTYKLSVVTSSQGGTGIAATILQNSTALQAVRIA